MHVVPHLPGSTERSLEPPPNNVSQLPLPPRARWWSDGDLAVTMLVFWIASVVRVAGAFMRHEVFGAEASLAFMSVLVVPWVFGRALLRSRRRPISVTPAQPGTPRPALRLTDRGDARARPAQIGRAPTGRADGKVRPIDTVEYDRSGTPAYRPTHGCLASPYGPASVSCFAPSATPCSPMTTGRALPSSTGSSPDSKHTLRR
jgi:hypothetical protein